MPVLRFASQSYRSRSLPLSAQRCVNMFTEKEPTDAKAPLPLFGSPGLTEWMAVGSGPIRGILVMQDILYTVSGTAFYRVASDGTITQFGLADIGGTDPVSMSDNGTQIMVVNGQTGYLFSSNGASTNLTQTAPGASSDLIVASVFGMTVGDPLTIDLDNGLTFATTISSIDPLNLIINLAANLPSSASIGNAVIDPTPYFLEIVDEAFYPADTTSYFDTYFVMNRSGTNEFFISGQNNGAPPYDGLQFASAEVTSSRILAIVINLEQLLILKEDAIETWYDAGTADFPFQRYDGATVEKGLAGSRAWVKQDQSVFFLSNQGIVYRLLGSIPIQVSTPAIEDMIQAAPSFNDAQCFAFTIAGHQMVVLTLPSVPLTLIYDLQSGLWHERESWDAQNQTLGRWRGSCSVRAYGQIMVGDAFSNQIGILDLDTYTEYGNTIRGLAITPPIHQDRKRIFMSRFELDVETGVGLNDGQGSDPQMMMDYSDDGGRTWSSPQQWRSMGKIGAYLTRLRWMSLGQFRQRVMRVTVTDPVRRTIISAHADMTAGM